VGTSVLIVKPLGGSVSVNHEVSLSRADGRSRLAIATYVMCWLAGFTLSALIYAAIPFYSSASLGQMMWTSGFAQSFVNGGWPSIYAHDFGMPARSPMAFGLAGGFLESLILLLLPVAAVDAYSIMALLYLALAFWGATKLAGQLGVNGVLRIAAAVVWVCLPMVWVHSGYSMLSLGFALLPTYLYAAIALIEVAASHSERLPWRRMSIFFGVALLAAFMDGYTFVLFFVAASLYGIFRFISHAPSRRYLFRVVAPTMAMGFGVAALLYMKYEGVRHFEPSPIDFFRAFGADLKMLVVPDQDIIWLWGHLGLSTNYDPDTLFGDPSVWNTTYCLPLILTAICGLWFGRRQPKAKYLVAIALFGIYFALGPSLKVNSVKPKGEIAGLMDASYASGSTGSAWISKHVTAFDNMRASYRWLALGMLGLWGLTIVLLASQQERRPVLAYAIASLVFLTVCMPNIPIRVASGVLCRDEFFALKRDLSDPMGESLKGYRKVAFLPRGNDFLANYLGAFNKFDTLNVGGDKNVAIAIRRWSTTFLALTPDASALDFVDDTRSLLARGEVDAAVFPFIDMLRNADTWPPDPSAISAQREQMSVVLRCLREDKDFMFVDGPLYGVLTLSAQGRQAIEQQGVAHWEQAKAMCPSLPPFEWPELSSTRFGHEVGHFDISSKEFRTDHRAGFLFFGPYQVLAPGDYYLEIKGKLIGDKGKVDIDVVANGVATTLAKATRDDISPKTDPLIRVPFHVQRGMRRIETRIWVAEDAELSISSLQVKLATDADHQAGSSEPDALK